MLSHTIGNLGVSRILILLPSEQPSTYLALKPHNENALTDTLLEVITPNNPEHALLNTALSVIYLLVQSSLQIWCTFVQGGGCQTRRASHRHPRACSLLACTP